MIALCILVTGIASVLAEPPVYARASPPSAYEPAPAYDVKPSYGKPKYEEEYDDKNVQYQYGYSVQDEYHGTAFSKHEQRNGYDLEGEYQVALPDSTIQRVRYRVDPKGGFVADVSYEGTPVYPEYKPKKYAPEPSYKAAAPYKAPEPYAADSTHDAPNYLPAPSRYAAAARARTYQA